ncbi:MAG: hypothetical protein AB7S74_18330 [Hyphomicrobium sp.]
MTKSKSMWVAVLLLLCLMVHSWRWSTFGDFNSSKNPPAYGWISLAFCLLSGVAVLGLVLERRWSVYLVQSLALAIIGLWMFVYWQINGLKLPYSDTLSNILGFIPAIGLFAGCLFVVIAFRRHFWRH